MEADEMTWLWLYQGKSMEHISNLTGIRVAEVERIIKRNCRNRLGGW